MLEMCWLFPTTAFFVRYFLKMRAVWHQNPGNWSLLYDAWTMNYSVFPERIPCSSLLASGIQHFLLLNRWYWPNWSVHSLLVYTVLLNNFSVYMYMYESCHIQPEPTQAWKTVSVYLSIYLIVCRSSFEAYSSSLTMYMQVNSDDTSSFTR